MKLSGHTVSGQSHLSSSSPSRSLSLIAREISSKEKLEALVKKNLVLLSRPSRVQSIPSARRATSICCSSPSELTKMPTPSSGVPAPGSSSSTATWSNIMLVAISLYFLPFDSPLAAIPEYSRPVEIWIGSELVPDSISSRRLIRRLPFSLDSAYCRLTYMSPVTFPSLWLTFCSQAPT
ncbi:Uncharacterised protein [Enterobacter cloacae]|nr:Uncharacterised protein [Enterobacter cloacae]